MRRAHHERRVQRLLFALAVLCLMLLAGCSALKRLDQVLYPSETTEAADLPQRVPVTSTPVAEPSHTPALAPTFTRLAHTPTAKPIPPIEPTSPPEPETGLHLVFDQGGSIYRGGYLGREPQEVANVLQLEAWDFCRGLLAMARGGSLEIIDLNRGTLASFEARVEG